MNLTYKVIVFKTFIIPRGIQTPEQFLRHIIFIFTKLYGVNFKMMVHCPNEWSNEDMFICYFEDFSSPYADAHIVVITTIAIDKWPTISTYLA